MRIKRIRSLSAVEADMTPMIDMTFQLIAFFMVLINFTEADQNERIKLPISELAKPPDAPLETPIFLHLTKEGVVIIGGHEVPMSGVKSYVTTEANVLKAKKQSPADATVIIRADADTATGKVQTLVQICQEAKFENFRLRAEEDIN
jgi:biopolymer transport protein ExbD